MKGYVIPDGNYVVRYCIPKFVNRQNGLPDSGAFRLNQGNGEDSLSVNWLEYFDYAMVLNTRGEREVAVARVRGVMQYDLDVKGACAFFSVGDLKRAVDAGGGTGPYVEHDPRGPQQAIDRRPARGPNPCHALAYGFPDDDYGVGVELRALAISDRDANLFPGVT